jgi:hypothetical protein
MNSDTNRKSSQNFEVMGMPSMVGARSRLTQKRSEGTRITWREEIDAVGIMMGDGGVE